jgi:hypothetical protein
VSRSTLVPSEPPLVEVRHVQVFDDAAPVNPPAPNVRPTTPTSTTKSLRMVAEVRPDLLAAPENSRPR